MQHDDEQPAPATTTTPTFDRRQRNIGPPRGCPDRRTTASGRTATDALKMACPFCGWSESAVVRSRGGIVTDQIRRRRECANPGCNRRFPTYERVDVDALARELIAAGEALPSARLSLSVSTWATVHVALHLLWGQAKDGQYDKHLWMQLQQALEDLRTQAPPMAEAA